MVTAFDVLVKKQVGLLKEQSLDSSYSKAASGSRPSLERLVKKLLESEIRELKTSQPEINKKAVKLPNEQDQRGLKLFGV